jgi:hypothetical protein
LWQVTLDNARHAEKEDLEYVRLVEFEAVRAVGHVNFVWNFTDIPQMMEAASSSETSLYLCHVVTPYTPEHTVRK